MIRVTHSPILVPDSRHLMSLQSLIFLYKLWWLLSLNILQRFFRTTLFLLSLLFSWYPNEILKKTCSFRILLWLNLLSIDDPGTTPSTLLISILSFYFSKKQSWRFSTSKLRSFCHPFASSATHKNKMPQFYTFYLFCKASCSLWIIIVINETHELEIPSFCAQ